MTFSLIDYFDRREGVNNLIYDLIAIWANLHSLYISVSVMVYGKVFDFYSDKPSI